MNKKQLLLRYYLGISRVSEELYQECFERCNNICEIEGCNNRAETLHHVVGRRRMVWEGNLIFLCHRHHQGEKGVHGYGKGAELNLKILRELQEKYFEMGFTEEEVRYLMGSKSNKLY